MKYSVVHSLVVGAIGMGVLWSGAAGAVNTTAAEPYRIVKSVQVPGTGGVDYVYADSEGRRLYVPRGEQVLVFDVDTLDSVGTIPKAKARGVAVDPKSHHGFCSSSPVVMWDSKTLETIKTIEIKGRPDSILFEPATERVYVFSHSQPNATVIDAKDGSVVGTIDLGGAPEQAVSDGKGRVYAALEDKDNIVVVDANTLKVMAHYDLMGKGGAPVGLALDKKNQILFAFCRKPQTCVTLSAVDGSIITTLPIGRGTDGGCFNPDTMEAFGSQGDGTLAIIKENSPTSFELAQTLKTKPRAKTCTLDAKTGRVILITTEAQPPKDNPSAATPAGEPKPAGTGTRGGGPALLDILVVGK